ncbi:MAG: LPS export ABC transporter periplasmic protein LptC [Desulfuromonadaceae bacterium]|nr:LPS export ABC transporter periplasmic protein LptC [Desulfuromonadaceae bacterium]
MLNLRRLLAILILIAVLFLGTVIWRHLRQQRPEDLLNALPKQIDLALEQLHYTQTEEGRRRWTLDADKAEYQRQQGQVSLKTVQLTLFEAGRLGQVRLQADQGLLDQEERQVEVWGNVIIKTERGEQLYTERLHYDDQQRRLYTDEPVRLLSERMELTGIGMQVDLEQEQLLIKKEVWMLLLPAEREMKPDE